MEVGAVSQITVDLGLCVVAAQQWNDVYEAIEFGLRVSLDDRLEFSKKRFDNIAADDE
jgi:hypothetical protein